MTYGATLGLDRRRQTGPMSPPCPFDASHVAEAPARWRKRADHSAGGDARLDSDKRQAGRRACREDPLAVSSRRARQIGPVGSCDTAGCRITGRGVMQVPRIHSMPAGLHVRSEAPDGYYRHAGGVSVSRRRHGQTRCILQSFTLTAPTAVAMPVLDQQLDWMALSACWSHTLSKAKQMSYTNSYVAGGLAETSGRICCLRCVYRAQFSALTCPSRRSTRQA